MLKCVAARKKKRTSRLQSQQAFQVISICVCTGQCVQVVSRDLTIKYSVNSYDVLFNNKAVNFFTILPPFFLIWLLRSFTSLVRSESQLLKRVNSLLGGLSPNENSGCFLCLVFLPCQAIIVFFSFIWSFRCGLELCIKLSWVRSKVSFGCCVVLRVSKNIRRSFFNTKSNDWTSELPLILVRPGYPIYFLLLWAQRMRSTVTRQVYFTSSTEAAKLAES